MVAAALITAAVVDVVVVVAWNPDTNPGHVFHQLLVALWPLLLLAGLVTAAYEFVLHHRLVAELGRISGPSMVQHLLPSEVLKTFLTSIYGTNEANRDVVSGVLGGEGLQPQGGDLTISTSTKVSLELRGIDTETYHLTTTTSHAFKRPVPVDRFVIFATSNALLRDSINAACRFPLFELYFIPDSSLFLESVDDLLLSTEITIDYIDHSGRRRIAQPSQIPPLEVKFDLWPNYLTFFREAVGPMPKLSTHSFLSDLRIYECDLSGIADDHVVRAIQGMTLRARTRQRVNDGFCYWQPPYPSYVERITFDARELEVDHSPPHEFRVMPFTFRSNTTFARWLTADEFGDLDVRSWMLPGHGVALLWRERK